MPKILSTLLLAVLVTPMVAQDRRPPLSAEASCQALLETPNVTLVHAVLKPATQSAPQHCYVQSIIAGRIRFHMQLPLSENWNGRLLNIGDGGKDGALDYSDQRLA